MLYRSTSETSLMGMAEDNMEEKAPVPDRTSRPTQEKGFIPSLEGIRGAAILVVLISHLYPPFSHFSWNLGMMGVTIFFVMSGYLITGILLKMQVPTRRYDHLTLFFANRVVRLSPALFLAISAAVMIWLGQGRSFALIRNHALSSFFYLENIFCRLPGHKDQVFAHAWSLAVEEQFYIVWAFAILPVRQLTPKLRTSFLLLVTIISIIYRWRMFHIKDMDVMSKSLSANAYALISGSLLTFNWTSLPPKLMRRWVGNMGIILFLATIALLRHDGLVYSGAIWGPFTTVIATLITIIGCVEHGNYFLELQVLRYLGRISYSLYLWHHVLLWFGGLFNQVTIASVSVMSFSFIIAHCSTIYFEEPLRERFKQTTWFKAQKASLAEHSNLLPSHTK